MIEEYRMEPCPFCGGKPEIVQEGGKNEYDLVECRNPDCLMWPKTHAYTVTKLAINAWNTVSSAPPVMKEEGR